VLARIKCIFKRGEVDRMQRDLDSMKLTLGIMLQALEFRKITVEKRYVISFSLGFNLYLHSKLMLIAFQIFSCSESYRA
jgi:hypothetical protein